ncbi:hypothetical protein B0T13DRAFT_25556 [Neurospora crassa]|nr:hypothetical protein B0T13DRAFT_25556 [Neurospora crassa]
MLLVLYRPDGSPHPRKTAEAGRRPCFRLSTFTRQLGTPEPPHRRPLQVTVPGIDQLPVASCGSRRPFSLPPSPGRFPPISAGDRNHPQYRREEVSCRRHQDRLQPPRMPLA